MNLLKAPYYFVIHTYLDYTPHVFRKQINCRRHSSFLYIRHGTYRYTFADGGFTARDGALVYLPQGAVYLYEVLVKDAKCLQIEVDIMRDNGRCAVFSDTPEIVGYYAEKEMRIEFENIKRAFNGESTDITALNSVYSLLFPVINTRENTREKPSSKIQAAVEYIHVHFAENILMSDLADLCFLSESQMRRLFREEYKCSPLAYKNRLIVNAAKKMLGISDYAVSDIADALGFPSVYAFSRFFKKEYGVSPSAFRKKIANGDPRNN